MKLKITINMDNAAFEDSGETSRIIMNYIKWGHLTDLVEDAKDGDFHSAFLHDINGNKVGAVSITK